jgi:hypothetical protein
LGLSDFFVNQFFTTPNPEITNPSDIRKSRSFILSDFQAPTIFGMVAHSKRLVIGVTGQKGFRQPELNPIS